MAKLELNSKDPAEREKAQQTINDLREKDIAGDQKVIDACGNGNAGSAACAAETGGHFRCVYRILMLVHPSYSRAALRK
ncbi:Uncharacterised protein [Buttiauxella agrestis]|uniref:DUF6862 domain-containing protein n=1 Tax=Buttiauxella agrestis TaxID=82977 RepID=A0A381C3N8_9ENTR|nr:hypothetical protein [Buttiauxella agrestis]SUW62491.1 Uncharacterised protein [Buttiauxella agrestis]